MFGLSGEDWTVIAALVGTLTLLATLAWSLYSAFTRLRDKSETLLFQKLSDVRDHAELFEKFGRKPVHQTYARAIGRLNARIADLFGPAVSWSALDRCLQIALYYPMALFQIAWLFGANGHIGSTQVLPVVGDWPGRLFLTLLLIVAVLTIFALFRSAWPDGALHSGISWLLGIATKRIPYLSRMDRDFVAIAIAFAIAFAVAGAFTVTRAGAFTVAIAFAGTLAAAFSLIGTIVGAAAISFTIAIIGTLTSAVVFDSSATSGGDFTLILIVFYAILPIANALLDTTSWAFTRAFMTRLSQPKVGLVGVLFVLTEIVLDIVLAIACLIALAIICALFVEAIDILTAFLGWSISTDWRSMVTAAANHPADPNSWLIIGMLGTTVIPTALHIGAGLGAIIPALRPRTEMVLARITDDMTEATRTEIARALARAEGISWLVGAWTTIITFGVLLAGALYLASLNGHWLVKIALWVTCWTHGQCPSW